VSLWDPREYEVKPDDGSHKVDHRVWKTSLRNPQGHIVRGTVELIRKDGLSRLRAVKGEKHWGKTRRNFMLQLEDKPSYLPLSIRKELEGRARCPSAPNGRDGLQPVQIRPIKTHARE